MVRTHTLPWKKSELEKLKQSMQGARVLAVADLERFPAGLFAQLRKNIQPEVQVRVTKLRVLQRAIKETGGDAEKLNEYANQSVALIASNKDAFEIYALLKKNKGMSPAKPGMIAPLDLVAPAGDTGLPPGPDLADLKAAGLNAQMKGASIILPEDQTLTKAGEVVTPAVATALAKLDVKPIEVKLNLVAAIEEGQIYKAQDLDVDLEAFEASLIQASTHAFNLAVEIAYATAQTAPVLVAKAFRTAKGVALEAGIVNAVTAEALVAKASRQAQALKEALPEAPAEEAKEEDKEQKEAPAKEEKKPSAEGKEEEAKEEKPAEEEKSSSEDKEESNDTQAEDAPKEGADAGETKEKDTQSKEK